MTRMLLMGPPGSGKGTQATRIADKLGIVPISTGDIFRHNVKSMTPLGVEAKKYINNGDFVPDEVTNRMVADRIAQADAEHGFLLDGYPRTKGQVEALDAMLAEAGQSLSAVVELEVPDEELVERLLKRAEIEGRADDTQEVIEHRLDLYHRETESVIQGTWSAASSPAWTALARSTTSPSACCRPCTPCAPPRAPARDPAGRGVLTP